MKRAELLKRAWRNRWLRRVCLAGAGFRAAELATWIALIAYAYTAGGVREASAVTVAQLVPATVFALLVGSLIRRYGAARIMRYGLAAQGVGMATTAVFLYQGDNAVAFVVAIVVNTAITTTRPAQSVLTPGMVDNADELTAANVFSGGLFAAAGLVGPAIAAVLMTTQGSWAVFAIMAGIVGIAAATVWKLPVVHVVADDDPDSIIAGAREIAREPGPRVMVFAVAACYFAVGAIDVLAVVIAVELLGKREAYSGYITTAFGAGSLIAGSIAVAIIGRRWISPWILASAMFTGIALVMVSLVNAQVAASLLVLVALGIALETYEFTALMLLQRVSRLDLLGHIFAMVEALQMAMLALGSASVPLAVQCFGSRWAPAAIGITFAVLIAAIGTRIVFIDRNAHVPITEMAVLRSIPLFAALPGPALETVAREARRVPIGAGDIVVRQGDPGQEYYAIVSGSLVVSVDGLDVRELGRGDGFGEIALVRDLARSATVRAGTDAVLLAVDRDPFLTALTGHAPTRERASSIATGYSDQKSDHRGD